MKTKIVILLSCLLLVSNVFADPPSSASYTLVQRGFLTGNSNVATSPSSTSYELPEFSMLGIANDPVSSAGYQHYPGFLLNVSGQLDPPINVQISNVGMEVTISWDTVIGATSYTVYRSDNPYAEFPNEWTSVTGIIGTTWSYTTTRTRRFYRVTANNGIRITQP